MKATIYHNPRCTKSRETLALLQSKGIEPEVIEYLKTPPSAAELDSILKKLGKEPREAMRRQEPPYKELALDNPALTRQQLVKAMVENPVLIERPIVLANSRFSHEVEMPLAGAPGHEMPGLTFPSAPPPEVRASGTANNIDPKRQLSKM